MADQQTSLHSRHLQLKAKMASFAGYDMPLQYSSVKEEVLAVREKVGIFDVSHMGEFFVTGSDAVAFVDYICTNDFKRAQTGKAVYSPICNESGLVLDDLISYKLDEKRILICVNAANIKKDWEWLNSQTSGFDVQLQDLSKEYSLIAVQGPQSLKVLEDIDITQDISQIDYYATKVDKWDGKEVIIARTGYTGEEGHEIFCSHQSAQKLWDQLLERGALPCGLAARDVLRLEVCFPLYGHEINQEITPLDANLKWTVKLSKENFIGKKALENYVPKYKTIKLVLDKGIPREGYPVLNSKEEIVGEVTSGTMSVMLGKGIALARIGSEYFSKEETYSVQIRNRVYTASRQTKAFYQGGQK
jgi:aminomethyltransferase